MNDQPYDPTNSKNPWLINKRTDPIKDDQGHLLTAEYIWSKCGDDRVALMEWVFHYYRKRGLPSFKVSDDVLKQSMARLRAKPSTDIYQNGVIKNSSTVGLKIAKHFTGELFLGARERKGVSCLDVFNSDELFKKVLKNRMGWCSSREDGVERPYVFAIDDDMIIQGMRSSRIAGNISHFKPMIAKFVYERYKAKSTIDFSAGWGARAAAALSCGVDYYGIDPLTFKSINALLNYYGGTGRCVAGGSERLDYSVFPRVDICFSCPPYFDVEIYSDSTTQSSNYKLYDNWLKHYWRETVKRCYGAGRYFAFVCVNKVRNIDILDDMCNVCTDLHGRLIESIPISVAKSHLSNKKVTQSVKKKTEYLVVFEAPHV